MSLESVRRDLINRLEEGDRGDRGWFVITRVHVALSWLKGIAEYLESRGSVDIRLNAQDFRHLGTIIESTNENPGLQLRRHQLLAMDKPLQLLKRVDGRSWTRIVLTELGRDLARTNDPAEVLEQSLSAIQFAVEPWTPSNRVEKYSAFDVHVYEITKEVLRHCGGYIDRNEFDFFVSRIRSGKEVTSTAAAIAQYRQLPSDEQGILLAEVSSRIPGVKAYSNWRDIGLHTFSLFSLGTSMVREGTRLLLTQNWVGRQVIPPAIPKKPQLRIPDPPLFEALLMPPAAPASNGGADAESFVAKVLRSQGWEVAFFTNRRGYGFDLWARRENRAMVIEVKSSLGALGVINMTRNEYEAAQQYGDCYVLAVVENMDSDSPGLHMIQNPAELLKIKESLVKNFVISRSEWLRASATNI